jgi:hypothetical protein
MLCCFGRIQIIDLKHSIFDKSSDFGCLLHLKCFVNKAFLKFLRCVSSEAPLLQMKCNKGNVRAVRSMTLAEQLQSWIFFNLYLNQFWHINC